MGARIRYFLFRNHRFGLGRRGRRRRPQRPLGADRRRRRARLRFLPLQGLISLATLVFGVALLMFLARMEEIVAGTFGKLATEWVTLPAWLSPEGAGHYVMAVIMILLLALFSRAVRVNRFSLNGLYRNRLARAFLGAARTRRAAATLHRLRSLRQYPACTR